MLRRTLGPCLLALAGCGQTQAADDNGALAAVAVPTQAPPAASSAVASAKNKPSGASEAAPRIGAIAERVYIRAGASEGSAEVGAIDLGESVVLGSGEAQKRSDCPKGWYPVVPEGYVCLDPQRTTLDARHPVLLAKRGRGGAFGEDAPFHWGESRETPLYRKLPSAQEQRRNEYQLDKHLARAEKRRKELAAGDAGTAPSSLEGVDVTPSRGAAPEFLKGDGFSPLASGGDRRPRAGFVPQRSAIAWSDEFFANGRSWLLTSDLLLAPKDKVAAFEPSTFHGVHLDRDKLELPIAFIRGEPRPKFRLDDDSAGAVVPALFRPEDFRDDPKDAKGRLLETPEKFPRLSTLELSGRARWQKGVRYFETRQGSWIRADDATVITAREPRGINLESDHEKWIEVSIYHGTLVAYAGKTPVFATLISPGLHGYRRVDGKPAKNTTPTGTFRIEWKHRSTTMSPDPKRQSYYLSEVPYTQFFHMPFALHAAYWHDDFGRPKSGGCINLSLADARWLFGWTDPILPADWHSVRSGGDRGPGTWVRVY